MRFSLRSNERAKISFRRFVFFVCALKNLKSMLLSGADETLTLPKTTRTVSFEKQKLRRQRNSRCAGASATAASSGATRYAPGASHAQKRCVDASVSVVVVFLLAVGEERANNHSLVQTLTTSANRGSESRRRVWRRRSTTSQRCRTRAQLPNGQQAELNERAYVCANQAVTFQNKRFQRNTRCLRSTSKRSRSTRTLT